MVLRRMTVAFALAGLAMVAVAAPAFAHAELKSSNPAKGASVATAPKQLELTFSEPVSPQEITVAGPQGAQWTVGQVSVAGPVVTAPIVQPVGPAGEYTITYKVLSEDGDPVTGTVAFTLTAPATTTTTPPPTTMTTATAAAPTSSPQAAPTSGSDSGGVPSWVWILIVVAAVLAAGAVVGRRVQSRKSDSEQNESSADR